MSFGIFEASITSEAEAQRARQESADKMAAAIYDVREKLGPVLFASRNIEEFRHKVAMMKNDQSVYKIIEAHLFPATGTVRRIVGRGGELEREFKALLSTGALGDEDRGDDDDTEDRSTVTDRQKDKIEDGERPDSDDVDTNSGDGSDADGDDDSKDRDKTYPDAPTRDSRRHTACYPGCDKNEAHAKKYHNKDARRRRADFEGDQDIKATYSPSDADLIPEGNFDGYINKVDQNSSKVQDRNFTSHLEARIERLAWDFEHKPKTPGGQGKSKLKDVTAGSHDLNMGDNNPNYSLGQPMNKVNPYTGVGGGQPKVRKRNPSDRSEYAEQEPYWPGLESGGKHRQAGPNASGYYGPGDYAGNGPASAWIDNPEDYKSPEEIAAQPLPGRQGQRDPLRAYIAWCDRNKLARISARNVAYYAGPDAKLCYQLAYRIRQAQRTAWLRRHGNRKVAAPDYLQKADDALTQLLNQKAEEFQETIAPLQQALVTVQQAQQLQQQQNPLNVLPPPGTVNVMPGGDQGPAGMPAPGAQDLGAAAQALAAPLGGAPAGGAGADQGAPPPAAAGGGLPPDLDQQAPPQTTARRERTAADVKSLWEKFQQQKGQSGNLGIGGDPDYEEFSQKFKVGPRALNRLKKEHGVVVGARGGGQGKGRGAARPRKRAEKSTNIAEEAVKAQHAKQNAAMQGHGYTFDKGANAWTKPGHAPIRNHWQHTSGAHDYDPDNPEQEFAPARGHGWEHASGPSGPPYVREQVGPGRHERKAAGWEIPPDRLPGPRWKRHQDQDQDQRDDEAWVVDPHDPTLPRQKQADLVDLMQRRNVPPGGFRHVAGWDWDNHLNGYTANKPGHFTCACNEQFPTPSGFHRCACGRQWNSYVIGTGGNSKEAAADKFLVREIPVRPDVIVANRKLASKFDPAQAYADLEGYPETWGDFEQQYDQAPQHEEGPPWQTLPRPKGRGESGSRWGMRKGAPFAGYEDFDDCTSQNSDKRDPSAYCGEIKHRTEDKKTAKTPKVLNDRWTQTDEGWEHPDGGKVLPSTDKQGHYQLWGPTVSFGDKGGGLAQLKQPHPDPKHLMNWYSWASGEGPKPPGTGFFGSVALMDPRTGAMHTLIDPGELGDGEDAGTPTMKKPPKDWARRGDGARWTRSPIGA